MPRPAPATTPAKSERRATCPECLGDVASGPLDLSCPTCRELYGAFLKLREHIYSYGGADLGALSAAAGVPPRVIMKMMSAGLLQATTPAAGSGGRKIAGAAMCDSCGQPSDGTALCGGCRSRFTASWVGSQERLHRGGSDDEAPAPAASAPARQPAPAPTPAPAPEQAVPLDEDFAAMLEEEGVELPPELRLLRGAGMCVRQPAHAA